uniref:Uncharacterized protein n=1 Tax=Oryza meridionalis TaxID=40149 RepID=A0A0E0FBH6_9ORYZ
MEKARKVVSSMAAAAALMILGEGGGSRCVSRGGERGGGRGWAWSGRTPCRPTAAEQSRKAMGQCWRVLTAISVGKVREEHVEEAGTFN